MKYFKFVCYSLLLMLLFNTSSLYAAPPLGDHTTHTPLSLMPEPLSGSHDTFSLAATWWLPDWQGSQGSRGSDDIGGGDIVKDDSDCMKHYNLYATCPSPKLSTGVVHPVAGMTCQKSCYCPSEYKYTSSNCSGKYTVSGGSCDGKYNDCVCKSEYSQNSSNCNGEYRPAGESCGGNYNRCEMRPECTVSSMSCTYGCAGYNSCDRCTSCKSNPDCDVSDKSCTYGCASYNSCSKCTSCKSNPDCSATAVSCDYGCASTNSCGICTSCAGNPDCDVADKFCDYGCASTNSCGKCTECKSCSNACDSGYSLTACSSSQVQTASKTNQCGNSCYSCRAKTCTDGGYEGTIPSGKTCTKVAYANLSCYTDCKIIQGNPRLIVNWSYSAGISTGVRLDAKKNDSSAFLGMMKGGTSGTLIYEDVAVGDLISSFSGYGIANDSTSGSESFNISANVPSVSISEAKDYYINITLSPADRTPVQTTPYIVVGCYLPAGYDCVTASDTPCGLRGADGKVVGNNIWSGGMSYGGGDLNAGQNVTIQVDSEIKCETSSYYSFVIDSIIITSNVSGTNNVDPSTRSFYLKANGDPGSVWINYRLK